MPTYISCQDLHVNTFVTEGYMLVLPYVIFQLTFFYKYEQHFSIFLYGLQFLNVTSSKESQIILIGDCFTRSVIEYAKIHSLPKFLSFNCPPLLCCFLIL